MQKMVERGRLGNVALVPSWMEFRQEVSLKLQVSVTYELSHLKYISIAPRLKWSFPLFVNKVLKLNTRRMFKYRIYE